MDSIARERKKRISSIAPGSDQPQFFHGFHALLEKENNRINTKGHESNYIGIEHLVLEYNTMGKKVGYV